MDPNAPPPLDDDQLQRFWYVMDRQMLYCEMVERLVFLAEYFIVDPAEKKKEEKAEKESKDEDTGDKKLSKQLSRQKSDKIKTPPKVMTWLAGVLHYHDLRWRDCSWNRYPYAVSDCFYLFWFDLRASTASRSHIYIFCIVLPYRISVSRKQYGLASCLTAPSCNIQLPDRAPVAKPYCARLSVYVGRVVESDCCLFSAFVLTSFVATLLDVKMTKSIIQAMFAFVQPKSPPPMTLLDKVKVFLEDPKIGLLPRLNGTAELQDAPPKEASAAEGAPAAEGAEGAAPPQE